MRRLALLLMLLLSPVLATTGRGVEIPCPVCQTKVEVYQIFSTNNAGGYDRDLFQRAGGLQKEVVGVATCQKCYYSGYADDFEKEIEPELKEKILGGGLVLPDSVTEGDEVPPWASHALAAQVAELQGADDYALANRYLAAAWAARAGENPFSPFLEDINEEESGALVELSGLTESKLKGANHADAQVLISLALLERLDQVPGELKKKAAAVVGSQLRNHGENKLLMEHLAKITSHLELAPAELQQLTEALEGTIAVEERYLEKAIPGLKAAADSEETDAEKKAFLTYLVAELSRRTGQDEQAEAYFERTLQIDNLNPTLAKIASQQRARLRGDMGPFLNSLDE